MNFSPALYGLTYLHRPGGCSFSLERQKSKSLCFWCILKMPSIQHLLIKPHKTHTHIPPSTSPQKMTSYYISEFFLCATFHSWHWVPNLRKPVGWKPGFFKLHERYWGVEFGSEVIGNFSTFGGLGRVSGVFFSLKFMFGFLLKQKRSSRSAVVMYGICWWWWWWFLEYLLFSPRKLGRWSKWSNMFQMGTTNYMYTLI